MRKSRIAAVAVAAVVLVVFFLTPFIYFQSSAYQIGGGTYDTWTARVSPSYYAFKCGAAYDVSLTTFIVGNGSWNSQKVFSLPMFLCQSQPS
jgi:hypothetical protein